LRYYKDVETQSQTDTQLFVDVIRGKAGRDQLGALLNQAFNVPAEQQFFDDFPIWDEDHNSGSSQIVRIGVYNGATLVSSTGVRMAKLKAPNGPLPIALIGAVATHPDWRGHGFASRTVQLASQWARDQGAAMILLWGSEYELYRKQGFELCGSQLLLPIANIPNPPAHELVHTGWNPALYRSLQSRRHGLMLSDSDRSWYESHRGVQWYWVGDASKPDAYAAIGRGIDLPNIVHEWGGIGSALRATLSAVRDQHPLASVLAAPQLLTALGLHESSATPEPLCMAHIIDPVQVYRYFDQSGEAGEILAESQNNGRTTTWNLKVRGRTYDLNDFELAPLFFGTQEGQFAFPLWIWGLDAC